MPVSTINTSRALTYTGAILQIVNATAGGFSTTSSTPVNTGLTASITPTLASSKILVMVNLSTSVVYGGNSAGQYNLLRNGSEICVVDYGVYINTSVADLEVGAIARNYLDSPATTSTITYSVQAFIRYGATANFGCGNAQTMTLLEIAA